MSIHWDALQQSYDRSQNGRFEVFRCSDWAWQAVHQGPEGVHVADMVVDQDGGVVRRGNSVLASNGVVTNEKHRDPSRVNVKESDPAPVRSNSNKQTL